MITFSKLGSFGKLGNQLFQIATTISTAKDNGTDYGFPGWKYNCYLETPIPTTNNFPGFLYNAQDPWKYIKCPTAKEMNLSGYFQCEKYFGHHKSEILEILKIKQEYLDIASKDLPPGRKTSLHVRRGDYLNFPQHHPTPSIDYYKKSMERLNNETDYFIVFSDDIQWCMENITGDNVIYSQETNEFIDLIKISLCDNHIIANSSFSWWGSYLSNRGITIAPSTWVGPSYSYFFVSDIYRKDMIVI